MVNTSGWVGGLSRLQRLAVAGLALVLVGAVALAVVRSRSPEERTLTASFASTINLYPGAQVKVLGVQVGTVTSVKVVGTSARVQMTYHDVHLPPDVHAVIVPPSIVGDRFVQLAPAWRRGRVLRDRARIGLPRTAVPVELDQTYRELNNLSVALGPKGANSSGALSRLVRSSAETLNGNGRRFHTSMSHLASALDTLSSVDGNYQRTVDQTGRLTHTLQANDATVRRLVLELVNVTSTLAAQRQGISRASNDLSGALRDVAAFTRSNRARATAGVEGIRDVSATLNRRVHQLDDLLTLAPVGFVDALNINQGTNYGLAKTHGAPLPGRTTSYAQRGIFTTNLGPQLSSVLTSVCDTVTGAQKAQLAPLCTAFAAAGNNLGLLLSQLSNNGKPSNGSSSGSGASSTAQPRWPQFLAQLRAQAARDQAHGSGGR